LAITRIVTFFSYVDCAAYMGFTNCGFLNKSSNDDIDKLRYV